MRSGLSTHSIAVGSRSDFEKLLAALEVLRLRPVIDRTFAFAEAPAAFAHLQGRSHFGKVVITVD